MATLLRAAQTTEGSPQILLRSTVESADLPPAEALRASSPQQHLLDLLAQFTQRFPQSAAAMLIARTEIYLQKQFTGNERMHGLMQALQLEAEWQELYAQAFGRQGQRQISSASALNMPSHNATMGFCVQMQPFLEQFHRYVIQGLEEAPAAEVMVQAIENGAQAMVVWSFLQTKLQSPTERPTLIVEKEGEDSRGAFYKFLEDGFAHLRATVSYNPATHEYRVILLEPRADQPRVVLSNS